MAKMKDRGDPLVELILKPVQNSFEEEELLLEAGWAAFSDADAREEYEALFPPSAETNRRIQELTVELASPDEKNRLQASKTLWKAAARREQWLRIPRVTERLIEALRGARGEIEENLASALTIILEHFPDRRAIDAFRPLLATQNSRVRTSAAAGALLSGRENAVPDVLPLSADPIASVRKQSLLWIMRSDAFARLTETARRDVQAAAIRALEDRVDDVRLVAINLLGHIGDGDALAALQPIKGRRHVVKSAVAGAIAAIRERTENDSLVSSGANTPKPKRAGTAKKRASTRSRATMGKKR
jgi:HEAT repeat protein